LKKKFIFHIVSTRFIALASISAAFFLFPAVPAPLHSQTPFLATADSLPAAVHVSIAAAAESEEIPLNRLTVFTIKLKWQGRLPDIEFDPPETPRLSNFTLAGSSSSNWVGIENGQPTSIKTFAYSLRPEGLGMGYVEGLRVSYLDKGTGEKHSLYTSRISIKVIDPLPEPDEAPLGLALTIGLLLCAALVVLVFQLEARAKKKEAARLMAAAAKPLEQEFLEELKNTIDINTTEMKEAFATLSRLLRRYLNRRYSIASQGVSTQEVVEAFRQATVAAGRASDEQTTLLEEVLQTCDLFKFSGEAGEPARLARVYALTENFLQMNNRRNPDLKP
jgi:hypothetical protein